MSGDDCKPAAKRSESFIDESGRQNKYNKKRSVKKKENKAYEKQQNLHDTFLLHNEIKEFYETKSPHILVITKYLRSIEKIHLFYKIILFTIKRKRKEKFTTTSNLLVKISTISERKNTLTVIQRTQTNV